MIIECKTCHARFRLDESKIKGKGARVKCRKCGEQIVVLKEASPGTPTGDAGGEGFLDLGSALRESPPDNLIRFPKIGAPPAAPEETAGKDEVDLAFEQLLKRSSETVEPGPDQARPEEPKPELPEEPKFELPEEPKFEIPEEPKFEIPEEPKFEIPEEPEFEPPLEFTFETQAESAIQPRPEEPRFALPKEPKDESPSELALEPPGQVVFEEGALGLSPETKDADISPAIASNPMELETEFPVEATALRTGTEVPSAPAPDESFLEGNATPPSSAVMDPGVTSPAEKIPEKITEKIQASQAPPDPPARHTAPQSGSRFARVAGAVLLLALLGAVGYYGFTDPGRRLLGSLSPRLAALIGGEFPDKAVSRFEVKNVIGYFDSGAASPRILVIKGQVTNLATAGKSGIRIHASLLDNTGNVLTDQAVYAGNVLPGAKIKSESRATLEKALVNPLGEHLMNMDVASGRTIPFMVLFFDAPENIESYKIEAKDNQ